MPSRVLISDFGVTGFRSFDSELQPMRHLRGVNLFVGRNNSGKSNVIAAVSLYCLASRTRNVRADAAPRNELHALLSDPLNKPMVGKAGQAMLWIPLASKVDQLFQSFSDWQCRLNSGLTVQVSDGVHEILENMSKSLGVHGLVSARFPDLTWDVVGQDAAKRQQGPHGSPEIYKAIFNKFSGYTGGGIEAWVEFFNKSADPFLQLRPLDFVEIPSVRKVIDSGTAFDGTFGEKKIIHTIAEWERPDIQNIKGHSEKFERLLAFARTVLEDSEISLQIPYQRDTIHVVKDGKTLPIERLGTGIHQVIMIAAAATVVDDSVVAIEEPETNLHPSLQRKLVCYLSEKTSNQYFITTHSAHILDAVPAAVFHVSLVDGLTKLARVETSGQRFSAVEDLGYRASDLIQTPIVVWVEGPSDRIYVTAWLGHLAPELVEGTHYSVMFYGGRLLSHLGATDPEVESFISLRRLNRYVVVLMDSDRKAATASINDTKKRIVSELAADADGGFAWVTEGREIENYLDHDILSKAMGKLVSDFSSLPDRRGSSSRYANFLEYLAADETKKSVADRKVALARAYVDISNAEVPNTGGDLHEKLERLIQLIKRANGSH